MVEARKHRSGRPVIAPAAGRDLTPTPLSDALILQPEVGGEEEAKSLISLDHHRVLIWPERVN